MISQRYELIKRGLQSEGKSTENLMSHRFQYRMPGSLMLFH